MKSSVEYKIKKLREVLSNSGAAKIYIRGDNQPFLIDGIVYVEFYGCELKSGSTSLFLDPDDIVVVAGNLPT